MFEKILAIVLFVLSLVNYADYFGFLPFSIPFLLLIGAACMIAMQVFAIIGTITHNGHAHMSMYVVWGLLIGIPAYYILTTFMTFLPTFELFTFFLTTIMFTEGLYGLQHIGV